MTIIVTGFSGNTLCCTNEAHFYCRNDNLCCRPIPCSRLSFSSLRRTLFWTFNAMYNWEQHNASWRDCMRVITPIFKKWLLGSPLEVFVTIHKIIACLLNHIGVNPRDTRTWPWPPPPHPGKKSSWIAWSRILGVNHVSVKMCAQLSLLSCCWVSLSCTSPVTGH